MLKFFAERWLVRLIGRLNVTCFLIWGVSVCCCGPWRWTKTWWRHSPIRSWSCSGTTRLGHRSEFCILWDQYPRNNLLIELIEILVRMNFFRFPIFLTENLRFLFSGIWTRTKSTPNYWTEKPIKTWFISSKRSIRFPLSNRYTLNALVNHTQKVRHYFARHWSGPWNLMVRRLAEVWKNVVKIRGDFSSSDLLVKQILC